MSKIINDPVHGFISIDSPLILELIDHPIFQRLRHIVQLGLTNYVYPGTNHSRFHHAIGAMHLMSQSLDVLRSKGILISNQEYLSAQIAILLHDLGHGPFSHTLENSILENIHHENISLELMHLLNFQYNGNLQMAIEMFENKYHRYFFHQLISSQLDVDRLDYLKRDSYFSGVKEGNVSSDRIIKMMNVIEDNLVIEEKGILSIESFLNARKIMYWQVYLHKTVYSAEMMLVKLFKRIAEIRKSDSSFKTNTSLDFFLGEEMSSTIDSKLLEKFVCLKDYTVWQVLENLQYHSCSILSELSKRIIHRKLFKCQKLSFPSDNLEDSYFNFEKTIEFEAYSTTNEIMILQKDGKVLPLSQYSSENNLGISPSKKKVYYRFSKY